MKGILTIGLADASKLLGPPVGGRSTPNSTYERLYATRLAVENIVRISIDLGVYTPVGSISDFYTLGEKVRHRGNPTKSSIPPRKMKLGGDPQLF